MKTKKWFQIECRLAMYDAVFSKYASLQANGVKRVSIKMVVADAEKCRNLYSEPTRLTPRPKKKGKM